MREAVLHLSGYNYQSIYGMNYRVKEQITMADLAFRVQHVIKTEIDVTEAQLSRNNIEMLRGTASFEDPHSRTGRRAPRARRSSRQERDHRDRHQARELAQGSDQRANIVNSDQVLQMPNLPKTLIVVGGGVIGVEYACMFAAWACASSLIEKRPRLLEFADQEIVEALCYHLRDLASPCV